MKSLFSPAMAIMSRLNLGRQVVLLGIVALLPLLVLAYDYNQRLGQTMDVAQVVATRWDLMLFLLGIGLLEAYLLAGHYFVARAVKGHLMQCAGAPTGEDVPETFTQGEYVPWLMAVQRLRMENGRILARAYAAVDEVEDAAGELSAFAREGAQGAQRQGEAVSSIASAMEQMVASIREIGEQAENTKLSSQQAYHLATQGAAVSLDAVQEMEGVSASVAVSAQHVERLSERSSQIDTIVHTIKSISEQTNLLALNAAIEAARAGDHGRGFAVVADEVRSLAVSSHDAAYEVEQQIQQVQQEIENIVQEMAKVSETVDRGVDFVQRSGQALQQIETGAGEAEGMITSIGAAIHELSAVSGDIAQHVEAINQMAMRNNTVTDEMALASQYVVDLSGKVRAAQV
jgi:methyl-accepting chemotaxis protein